MGAVFDYKYYFRLCHTPTTQPKCIRWAARVCVQKCLPGKCEGGVVEFRANKAQQRKCLNLPRYVPNYLNSFLQLLHFLSPPSSLLFAFVLCFEIVIVYRWILLLFLFLLFLFKRKPRQRNEALLFINGCSSWIYESNNKLNEMTTPNDKICDNDTNTRWWKRLFICCCCWCCFGILCFSFITCAHIAFGKWTRRKKIIWKFVWIEIG